VATTAPAPASAPAATAPGRIRGAAGRVAAPVDWIEQVAGMMLLLGQATRALLTPPFAWRAEFVSETFTAVKRSLIPVVVTTTVFGTGAPGLTGGNIVNVFGAIDRMGAFFVMACVREFAPWINGMVVAGVAGTAICADLGARKVREEIDALQALGVDPVATLVAPRLLALGLVTPALNLLATMGGIFGGWIATVVIFQDTHAGYISTFASNFTLVDLIGSMLKTSLFGFIIAIVCCYKGMHVKGGPEGVGRAVNQAVVIAFAAIWAFNYMFNSTMLAAFPETGNLH